MLLESSGFPRHKVCGEFISSEALPILKAFVRNGECLDFDSVPLIESTRVFLDNRVVDFKVEPGGASLSRHRLDFELWKSAIAEGVLAHDRVRVTGVCNLQPLFEIETERGRVRARTVIDASGRWSNLSRISRSNHRARSSS